MVRVTLLAFLLPLITAYSFPKVPSKIDARNHAASTAADMSRQISFSRRQVFVTTTVATVAAACFPQASLATGNEKVEFASERYVPRIKAGAKAYKKELYSAVGSGDMRALAVVVAEPRKVSLERISCDASLDA
jgi:hypothetical protein